MTEQTQLILGLFVPIYAIGGWALKILWDMNTQLGEIKGEIREIKLEIREIKTRLDHLESGIVTKR